MGRVSDSQGEYGVKGEVTVAGEIATPAVVTDGQCLKQTLLNLKRGVGGKPMKEETLTAARAQAINFLGEIVKHYAMDISPGEVGANGSGKATQNIALAGRCPTGLLYGRVQSGKTLAMIALAAAAFDNNFKLVIVFTTNYLELVKQTKSRFQAVDGRKIFDSTRSEDWSAEAEHFARQLSRSGVVIVCAKDPTHTNHLVHLLEKTKAADYPAIVFDDEADQATPDTAVAARARVRDAAASRATGKKAPKAPERSSAIFRRIVLNDDGDEVGHSAREKLKHHVFIQVTATPYALLLQNIEHPLRPKFTLLVEPGQGYTGGEHFFASEIVGTPRAKAPIVFTPSTEATELTSSPKKPPLGLRKAICFFLNSAASQQLMFPETATGGQNFLCHTSAKMGDHGKLRDLIRGFVDALETELLEGLPDGTYRNDMVGGYDELKTTLPGLPNFAEIVAFLKTRLHLRTFYVVNSEGSDAAFSSGINFIVGGNILGRGLTIDNLLVTYYLRSAKVTQMDTMLQHARMFGYRSQLMAFTRVYLPESLALRFHHIHQSEQKLRDQFRDLPSPATPAIQRAANMRPTRLNVLDGGAIGTFGPGEHLWPYLPVYARSEVLDSEKKIRRALQKIVGSDALSIRFKEVPIADMISLIKLVPVSDADEDRWNRKAITKFLEWLQDQGSSGCLYVRSMNRGATKLMTGAVSDDELHKAKARATPVLFLFHENGTEQHWDSVPFFYPSLVFPSSMNHHVFNISE
jgi:hypothetical protein